jgi:hypothetical protein
MEGMTQDIFFRVVPIKDKSEKNTVEERAKTDSYLKENAQNQSVQVIGRPMKIETNMQNKLITLVLPLADLPVDNNTRQEVMDHLSIYIEHSDGTKEWKKGKVISFPYGSK